MWGKEEVETEGSEGDTMNKKLERKNIIQKTINNLVNYKRKREEIGNERMRAWK